ncbi:divalent-cation tolerance protein CutA [Ideonella sp. DXS22W]|uniref:Divalent-cation tolerance protein CutA n=1 Tax=Pseudaquabacterium inlustre TaxID=2984192 RepID=A0ABU9CKA8_9BURK
MNPVADASPATVSAPTPLIAVITTVATEADADTLARGAVAARLAACVQVEAIRSTYRWQGQVCQEPEQRLLFKTTAHQAPALMQWLAAQHPYELPSIYTLPVADASPAYAAWVQAETGAA